MARKPIGKKPKVQRGLSLDVELYEAIQADSIRLGKSWNDIAESVLRAAFLAPRDLRTKHEKTFETQDRPHLQAVE